MDDTNAPVPSREASPWILDVDARNFEEVALRGSTDHPVVVDFWASWCEPCKQLTPKLEAAAREGNGRFVLAKVDADKNPELSQALRVRGLPTVLLLDGGRIVDGFEGAVPDSELEQFLARIPGEAPAPDPVATLRAKAADDRAGAMDELATLLDDPNHGVAARVLLAELQADAGDLQAASGSLEGLAEAQLSPEQLEAVARVRAAAEAASDAGDLGELERSAEANPDDPAAQLEAGLAFVANKRWQRGLELLLESVRADPSHADGAAKQAMLDAFETLGLEDPIANDFRFQLSLEILA